MNNIMRVFPVCTLLFCIAASNSTYPAAIRTRSDIPRDRSRGVQKLAYKSIVQSLCDQHDFALAQTLEEKWNGDFCWRKPLTQALFPYVKVAHLDKDMQSESVDWSHDSNFFLCQTPEHILLYNAEGELLDTIEGSAEAIYWSPNNWDFICQKKVIENTENESPSAYRFRHYSVNSTDKR